MDIKTGFAGGAMSRCRASGCVAVAPLLILTACGVDDSDRSTEVRIAAEWVVDSLPLVSIGVIAGDEPYIFSRIVAVEPFRGGFLVADGMAMELRRFDSQGRHVETVGGEGEGPGEFVLLRSMYVIRGDTVLAWDLRSRRLTIFSPSLELVATETVDAGSQYVVASAFETGELLLWPFGPPDAPGTPGAIVRPVASFVAYRRGSEGVLDTVVELPARPSYVMADRDYVRLPFTVDPQFAPGESTMWAGSGQNGLVLEINARGDVISRLKLPPGAPIPAGRVAREEAATGAPSPDRYPAFDRIVVDDLSRVWTRSYLDEQDDEQTWTVWAPGGEVLARVIVPRALRVSAVTGDRVIGVWRDALDVESVRVYRIREES